MRAGQRWRETYDPSLRLIDKDPLVLARRSLDDDLEIILDVVERAGVPREEDHVHPLEAHDVEGFQGCLKDL